MILNSPYISGSLTVTGNTTIQGQLTVTGSLSGTASLASNSLLLQGTGSTGFATTASVLQVSSSQQQISSSQQQISASLLNVIAVYATTGSNSFRADQSITGSLVVTGQIIAQTLNVQQVTSSIIYSSGSNNFGCDLNSRQTFTGSVNITGSQTVFGNVGINAGRLTISASSDSIGQHYYMSAKGETNVGFSIYEYSGIQYINASGSMILRYNNMGSTTGVFIIASGSSEVLRITAPGNMGIGTTTPSTKLDVYAGADATSNLVLWGQTIRNEANGAATGYGAGLKLKISTDNVTNEIYKWAGIAAVAGTGYSNRTDLALFANAASTSNAIEKVRITGDGYVGINTCTPSNLLHIEASNNTTNQFRVNSCDGLNAGIRSYTTCDGAGLIINHYYAVSGNPFLRTSDFVSNQGDAAATQMRFFTKAPSANAALAMIITCGGNVGIGTSTINGNSKLQVDSANGTAYCSNAQLRISGGSVNNNRAQILFSDNTLSDGKISYYPASAEADRLFSISARSTESDFVIRGNGSVGIGTCSPKTYSTLTNTGQLINLNNIGIDVGQSYRFNNYYNSGTGTDRTISTGFAGSIGYDNGCGAMTFSTSTTSIAADNNVTTTERIRITCGGVLRFSNVPYNNYHLDTSTSLIAVANGGTISFETFSGFVLINNMSNGNIGMWMVGAGATVLVSQVYGAAVGTMAYSSGINGYVWTSNSGATQNYGVFAVRTRANA